MFISDLDGDFIFNNNININPGNTDTRIIGGVNESGINTFSGNILRNSNQPLSIEVVNMNGTVELSGIINGSGNLRNIGPGITILSGINTFSGSLEIASGTISVAANSALGTGELVLGNGSTTTKLFVSENTSRATGISIIDGSTAGVIEVAPTKTFSFSGGLTNTGANNATKFGKAGAGTFIISGTSTYAGQIQIGNGTVIAQNNSALGANESTVNRGVDLGLNVGDESQSNDVYLYATDGITVPQSIYVAANTSSAARTIGLSGSGTATYNNEIYLDGNLTVTGGSGTTIISGNLINTGGLIIDGGTVNLSGSSNTYSGDTDINSGTLVLLTSTANSAITVLSGATLRINGADVTVASLTVESGGVVEIEPGMALTVTNALTNNTAAGIVIKSPTDSHDAAGSLIFGSLAGTGTLTAQRHILQHTTDANGWHLISSPVNNPVIATNTNLAPGASDDFYAYGENTHEWLNYKVGGNGITNMSNGIGYLVSYQSSTTKTITGAPNAAAVTHSNFSVTAGKGEGWHLVGNPFSSAIAWNNHEDWVLNNINTVAQRMNDGGSFSTINNGGIIPVMQGFWVQASTHNNNTLTIPLAARAHNFAQGWTKTSTANSIKLIAHDLEQEMWQESVIIENENSTEGFDAQFDARFIPWYAPHFYSVVGDDKLIQNSLPAISEESVTNFGFEKNSSDSFSIELQESVEGKIVYLFDNLLNKTQNLTEDPVYYFTSNEGDNPNRFRIHFGALSLDESSTQSAVNAYVHGHTLYILNAKGQTQVELYDLQGCMLQSNRFVANGLHSQEMALPAGVYVVRVMDDAGLRTAKVVVR